jgi:hypothetical protein
MSSRIESGSSLGVFRTCPKKYEFSYEQRLTPKRYSSPLGYGTFIHLHRARKHGQVEAERELVMTLEDLLRANPDQADQIQHDYLLAGEVIERWFNYWVGADSSLAEPELLHLEIEQEWEFPVDPIGRYIHVGKRDGYVEHPGWGKRFLYELKTAAARGEDNYMHRLHLDHQINSNLLALHKEGKPAEGVIYDIIWKPQLRRKTQPDETLEEFRDRILAEYDADPAGYFARLTVSRTPEQLIGYERELIEQYEVLAGLKVKYRNGSACVNHNMVCPFFDLCMDPKATEEQLALFHKRDKKLPELSKEIQE